MDITGLGSVFDFAKGILDRFWPKQADESEKIKALGDLVPMLQARENQIVQAQKEIIVAEMAQGDAFTKRARPTVVYMGLVFIALIHVIFPIIINLIIILKSASAEQVAKLSELTNLSLPGEFWAAWASVVSIWSLGRSFEKNGVNSKMLSILTGNKSA